MDKNERYWADQRSSFAHLGTYKDVLVVNNTDLNNRSTTSLTGT